MITTDLLMDRIVHLDAKHCQNDDSYFVFEDTVRDMLMFLIRDPIINDGVKGYHESSNFINESSNCFISQGNISYMGSFSLCNANMLFTLFSQ